MPSTENRRILTSQLSDKMAELYDDFFEKFGFGPCGSYAALKREQGWGMVGWCYADDGTGYEFPHYVIVDADGDIIDFTNPFDAELIYGEVELLNDDEMPDLQGDGDAIRWLKTKGA